MIVETIAKILPKKIFTLNPNTLSIKTENFRNKLDFCKIAVLEPLVFYKNYPIYTNKNYKELI